MYFCIFMPHPVPLASDMGLSPVSDIPNLQFSWHLLVSKQRGQLHCVGVTARLQIENKNSKSQAVTTLKQYDNRTCSKDPMTKCTAELFRLL